MSRLLLEREYLASLFSFFFLEHAGDPFFFSEVSKQSHVYVLHVFQMLHFIILHLYNYIFLS